MSPSIGLRGVVGFANTAVGAMCSYGFVQAFGEFYQDFVGNGNSRCFLRIPFRYVESRDRVRESNRRLSYSEQEFSFFLKI